MGVLDTIAKNKCSNTLCFKKATKFLRASIKGTAFQRSIRYCDKCAKKVHEQIMSGALYNNYDEDSYKEGSSEEGSK